MPRAALLAAIVSVVVLATALGPGCDIERPRAAIVESLRPEDADDLAQQFAMMIATDHGGWLLELDSTLTATPTFEGPATRSFTVHGMTYDLRYGFTTDDGHALGTLAAAVDGDTVDQVDGVSRATGTIVGDTPFSADFRHSAGPITAEALASGSDTIAISGVADDSLFATFRPAFRGGIRHVTAVAFVDYELSMRRDPALHPFPAAGVVNANVFERILNSPNPADDAGGAEATLELWFDGSDQARLAVRRDPLARSPRWYRVQLRTGALSRL